MIVKDSYIQKTGGRDFFSKAMYLCFYVAIHLLDRILADFDFPDFYILFLALKDRFLYIGLSYYEVIKLPF